VNILNGRAMGRGEVFELNRRQLFTYAMFVLLLFITFIALCSADLLYFVC